MERYAWGRDYASPGLIPGSVVVRYECFIDRDGMLFVPGLRRGVHAGNLMSLSLLPQLFSALRAESEKQKRQAKRLAFLEADIRMVRQLGLAGAAVTSAS